jgi:hypothetical protein
MSNPAKKYLVGGVLVEAVKSEGGGFYELTVVETGDKQRYLADVFESVAEPLKAVAEIQDETIYDEDERCEWIRRGLA